jgi:hypothetical protein
MNDFEFYATSIARANSRFRCRKDSSSIARVLSRTPRKRSPISYPHLSPIDETPSRGISPDSTTSKNITSRQKIRRFSSTSYPVINPYPMISSPFDTRCTCCTNASRKAMSTISYCFTSPMNSHDALYPSPSTVTITSHPCPIASTHFSSCPKRPTLSIRIGSNSRRCFRTYWARSVIGVTRFGTVTLATSSRGLSGDQGNADISNFPGMMV